MRRILQALAEQGKPEMKFSNCTLLTLVLLVSLAAPSVALSASPDSDMLLARLMTAVSKNDHPAFILEGTEDFKSGITKEALGSVADQLGSLIQGGYEAEYLTDLNQRGFVVHLWKIHYKNTTENTLAKLVISKGKVAGFWLQ